MYSHSARRVLHNIPALYKSVHKIRNDSLFFLIEKHRRFKSARHDLTDFTLERHSLSTNVENNNNNKKKVRVLRREYYIKDDLISNRS